MIKVASGVRKGLIFGQGPLALLCFEGELFAGYGLPKAQTERLAKAAAAEAFRGKHGETASVVSGPSKILLCGLGKKEKVGLKELRETAAAAFKLGERRYPAIGVAVPSVAGLEPTEAVQAVGEGLLLASYRFTKYKQPPKDERVLKQAFAVVGEPALKSAADKALARAQVYADSICLVRDLVNEGPSDKQPDTMAAVAKDLGGPSITVEIWGKDELTSRGMNAILGVARGSAVEPRFVHMVYKPAGEAKRRIGLVGKGITFDSGGLSLKPPQSMETMKMDMAGAATVLAIFKALPKLKLPIEVHGFTPFTYNMPGGDAMKPGDIVRAYNGKTIEVLNTDAEGRLILADALAYACKQKLDEVFDLATLTGAALIALGSSVTAAMTNDSEKLKAVAEIGRKAGEPIWELPLFEEYAEGIKSKVADLQNISSVRGEAGTIIGGLFLKEFVSSEPWIHFDIAGTAWTDRGGALCPAGGTGAMVRTLLDYLAKAAA